MDLTDDHKFLKFCNILEWNIFYGFPNPNSNQIMLALIATPHIKSHTQKITALAQMITLYDISCP